MWIPTEHEFEESHMEEFYLAEHKVCRISTLLDENNDYRGFVYHPNFGLKYSLPVSITDKDVDILKLKCLIKARDLGWRITKF